MPSTKDSIDWWEHRWLQSHWDLKFALWPRWCYLSGELIWLEYGYRGELAITGPGDPVVEIRWHNKGEHLLWILLKETKY